MKTSAGSYVAPPTTRSPPPPLRPRDPSKPGDRAARVFNLRLTEDQMAELRALALQTGIPIQSHIRRAVIDYLYLIDRTKPRPTRIGTP